MLPNAVTAAIAFGTTCFHRMARSRASAQRWRVRALAEAQDGYEHLRQADRLALDDAQRQETLRLATDFPAV